MPVHVFCTGFSRLEVPEEVLGGIPLGLGLIVKINLLNIHVVLRLLPGIIFDENVECKYYVL